MHPLANYSINDFDKHNCLKLSFIFYFILAFLLRGYAIGIMSLSNLRDKLSLIQWVYSDSSLFYLSLATGIPGLILLIVIFARKPKASHWIQTLWPKFLLLSSIAICVDLSFYWGQKLLFGQGKLNWLIVQTIIGIGLLVLAKKSKRAQINLEEFPQEIDDTPRKVRPEQAK
ncbi:DUF2919 family protein [Thalassotalea psychrophila]|uniref:DUF2919 family protein n=1 Tax=Thalassotalea psychrophila TaxID=3065647 RepID=A0ABY9TYJ4_9GAMM|nr:DUF2919 family protein [Colwelliaceae bacterium SQ149]